MKLIFIELSPFEKYRKAHLNDDEYRHLQNILLEFPEKGDVIQGLSGLRKMRLADSSRHKGKRGGARVIYYYAQTKSRIYFVTAYGKDKQTDINDEQRALLLQVIDRLKKLE